MPLALLIASRSMVLPCSVTTSRGMICTLAGKSASLVPVLPSEGACCSGGPELLLFGPLPSSIALAASAAGFVGWFERVAVRFALVTRAVDACCGFAGRLCGALISTGGSAGGFSCACAGAGISAGKATQKNPAKRYPRRIRSNGRDARAYWWTFTQ